MHFEERSMVSSKAVEAALHNTYYSQRGKVKFSEHFCFRKAHPAYKNQPIFQFSKPVKPEQLTHKTNYINPYSRFHKLFFSFYKKKSG